MKSDYSAGFEQFWKIYPRKTAKRAAWLEWLRQVKPLLEQEVIDTLQKQVDSHGHFSDDQKRIPHGRTWLHQWRWEDEIEQRHSKAGYAAPKKGTFDGLF